ncbi:MAG: hypothetical protein WC708_19215 [Lentisphaeria bacterium]
MGIPWEENPKIQKAQLFVTLGVLAFLAVAGALAGEWQMVAICALVVAGLALCWGALALALIATLKVLAKTDRRASPKPATSKKTE